MSDKPKKVDVRGTLSPETHDEREAKAEVVDATVNEAKKLVSGLSQPGHAQDGSETVTISPATAKQLWEAETVE